LTLLFSSHVTGADIAELATSRPAGCNSGRTNRPLSGFFDPVF